MACHKNQMEPNEHRMSGDDWTSLFCCYMQPLESIVLALLHLTSHSYIHMWWWKSLNAIKCICKAEKMEVLQIKQIIEPYAFGDENTGR